MHDPSSSDPDGYALYQRLLAGEINASADIALAYYDGLCIWLAHNSPRLDPDYYQMAIDDAMSDLFLRPRTYDPSKASLLVFLRMASKNRLLNILRTERRHSSRRAPIDAVEDAEFAVKYGQGGMNEDPAEIIERHGREEELLAQMTPQPSETELPDEVIVGLTDSEREVLKLHIRHERKTAMYARAMGIVDLPLQEQQIQVKRLRDKLDKRLRRAGVNI